VVTSKGRVCGLGRLSTCIEVMSIELLKLSSLVVSWIDQTLGSPLSTTSICVLDAREIERGSWSGCLSPLGRRPSDSACERVTWSDNETFCCHVLVASTSLIFLKILEQPGCACSVDVWSANHNWRK
jgi:hypothetical protein